MPILFMMGLVGGTHFTLRNQEFPRDRAQSMYLKLLQVHKAEPVGGLGADYSSFRIRMQNAPNTENIIDLHNQVLSISKYENGQPLSLLEFSATKTAILIYPPGLPPFEVTYDEPSFIDLESFASKDVLVLMDHYVLFKLMNESQDMLDMMNLKPSPKIIDLLPHVIPSDAHPAELIRPGRKSFIVMSILGALLLGGVSRAHALAASISQVDRGALISHQMNQSA